VPLSKIRTVTQQRSLLDPVQIMHCKVKYDYVSGNAVWHMLIVSHRHGETGVFQIAKQRTYFLSITTSECRLPSRNYTAALALVPQLQGNPSISVAIVILSLLYHHLSQHLVECLLNLPNQLLQRRLQRPRPSTVTPHLLCSLPHVKYGSTSVRQP
jgi:hypothetical protein